MHSMKIIPCTLLDKTISGKEAQVLNDKILGDDVPIENNLRKI